MHKKTLWIPATSAACLWSQSGYTAHMPLSPYNIMYHPWSSKIQEITERSRSKSGCLLSLCLSSDSTCSISCGLLCNKSTTNQNKWNLSFRLTWVRLVTRSVLQSRKWRLIGRSWWYCGTLCGRPFPALTDNWIRDEAHMQTYHYTDISETPETHEECCTANGVE